jgi:hypothetical protein
MAIAASVIPALGRPTAFQPSKPASASAKSSIEMHVRGSSVVAAVQVVFAKTSEWAQDLKSKVG